MKHLHIIERKRAKALGMLRYFTGKPCKYGHYDERRTSIGHCVTCLKILHSSAAVIEQRKSRYYRDRKEILSKQKEYRESNPDLIKERKKQEYEKHSHKYVARMRRWRESDPDRSRELNRRVYLKNHEHNKLRNRAWRLDNPEREAALKAHKRALKRNATPEYWKELTLFVHEEALKLAKLRSERFGFDWHVDHMVPLKSKRFCGLHVWYNLQVIPADLNLYKGNKLIFTEPFEWLQGRAL